MVVTARRALEPKRIEVDCVLEAQLALSCLREGIHDLAILDEGMRGSDGRSVYDVVEERYHPLSQKVVPGAHGVPRAEARHDLGQHELPHLVKPFDLAETLWVIEQRMKEIPLDVQRSRNRRDHG